MRAILLILIVAVVIAIAAIGTGLVNINQTRSAEVPAVAANGAGVTAKGGQAPAFDVQTGSVTVGSKPATVKVPTVQVKPAGSDNAAQNQAAPANQM